MSSGIVSRENTRGVRTTVATGAWGSSSGAFS